MMDDIKYNQYKDKADYLINELRKYPIHDLDTRLNWDIVDVKKSSFTEGILDNCFKLLLK